MQGTVPRIPNAILDNSASLGHVVCISIIYSGSRWNSLNFLISTHRFLYLLLYFTDAPFFLGKKGKLKCDGGVPVTDKTTCEDACTLMGIKISGELSGGNPCFKGSGRRGKGGCKQDGKTNRKSRLICEKQCKYIFRHSKINLIKIKGKNFHAKFKIRLSIY